MAAKKTSRNTEEDIEAFAFAEYLDYLGVRFTHIPNETWTPSWGQKIKNKKKGVRKGPPDYLIIVRNRLIFIELKKIKGGVVSDEQRGWLEDLNNCFGVDAYVAAGCEEAIKIVNRYLE